MALGRRSMMAIKIVGGAFWLGAYARGTWETRHGGRPLPPEAMAANAAWEALYGLGGLLRWRRLTPENRIQTVINVTWLIADLVWIRQIRDRDRQMYDRLRRALAPSLLLQGVVLYRRSPDDAARLAGLAQNAGISAIAAWNAGRAREDPHAPSLEFSALRTVGTLIPTLTSGFLRGFRPRYAIPGLICLALDAYTVVRVAGLHTRSPLGHVALG